LPPLPRNGSKPIIGDPHHRLCCIDPRLRRSGPGRRARCVRGSRQAGVASIAFLCWRWRCDTDRSALHASSPLCLGVGALATVTAAGWAYLLLGAGIKMDMGGGQKMVTPSAWSTPYAALISIMWWVMMVAMMLPTAAPTVLLVTTLAWDRVPQSQPRSDGGDAVCVRAILSSGAASASSPLCCNGGSKTPDCYPRRWPSVMDFWQAPCLWPQVSTNGRR